MINICIKHIWHFFYSMEPPSLATLKRICFIEIIVCTVVSMIYLYFKYKWCFFYTNSTYSFILQCASTLKCKYVKVAGVKVYPRQTWNFRSHAVSACIGLWRHSIKIIVFTTISMRHRLMDERTACIAPWHHMPIHAVTAWGLWFWFCLGYTFTPATL